MKETLISNQSFIKRVIKRSIKLRMFQFGSKTEKIRFFGRAHGIAFGFCHRLHVKSFAFVT